MKCIERKKYLDEHVSLQAGNAVSGDKTYADTLGQEISDRQEKTPRKICAAIGFM